MQVNPTFLVVALAASLLARQTLAQATPINKKPPLTLAKPLGDYVPCLFDRDQDASLHAQRTSRRLIQPSLEEWVLLGYLDAAHKAALATTLSNHDATGFAVVLDEMQTAGVLHLPAGITVQLLADNLKAATSAVYHDIPRDVACSQSLLSWSEAKDAYNQRIADTYLVYQVNVRNLNPQKEFLMQDVQVAVDDREFAAGRDKIIARGVALQGQTYSRRNSVERLLEAVATLGLALTGVLPAQSVRDGVSVFAAGLVPGFASLAPDRSDDQMTRFNDTSFSAAQAYKIVVPKSGSATFVTYLPFRIFAEGKTAKTWTPAQWTRLSNSSFVIISGVHITEE